MRILKSGELKFNKKEIIKLKKAKIWYNKSFWSDLCDSYTPNVENAVYVLFKVLDRGN